jgi:hypothetical protein
MKKKSVPKERNGSKTIGSETPFNTGGANRKQIKRMCLLEHSKDNKMM